MTAVDRPDNGQDELDCCGGSYDEQGAAHYADCRALAGAGEQQREQAARYIALLLGADRDFPSPAALSAGRYHLAELLALLGGPRPDGEVRQHRMDADCWCQPVQGDNGAWDHQ